MLEAIIRASGMENAAKGEWLSLCGWDVGNYSLGKKEIDKAIIRNDREGAARSSCCLVY